MFLRSQYAYKTAAGMTLAGQFAELFVMMRSCLEYAGYALLIFADPRLEEVFVNRHVDNAGKKAQRKKFEIPNVIRKIAHFDQKLGDLYKDLYDRSIDFGGHPNPHGMLGAMNIDKDEDEQTTGMTTFALTVEPRIIEFAMHKAAQVGLTSLYIFQHIFKEKFELLGIRVKNGCIEGFANQSPHIASGIRQVRRRRGRGTMNFAAAAARAAPTGELARLSDENSDNRPKGAIMMEPGARGESPRPSNVLEDAGKRLRNPRSEFLEAA